MSGETSLKFLIPESSCQKAFEVWALFANETKESVLRCDWVDMYYCDSAPGYTHTLENRTAVITVSRDLEKKPEDFICESLFRPKTDPIRCLCKRAAVIIPEQPDSDGPWQVGLIVGVSVGLVVLLVILVGIYIYIRCCRPNSSESKPDLNVRPDERKPLNKEKMNAPKISATDSQKSSTATLICFSCGAVQPKEETISQTGEPSMDVPQMSAADLQESSTPAVTPPPTETVPPKKETKIKPHP
ncbi:uncharacterized protein LOC112567439 isoform X2 [Pomacea canaliculata]|uniref:uncharacterized protein LOC112567439 isoform X2 n=1 Tax=Pomacea canaliculata TaxID=400727 RepID=UPI000D728D27|nr:uncharacterized protein LOC112567439 isoform X2 [Pomacea canaliculata]